MQRQVAKPMAKVKAKREKEKRKVKEVKVITKDQSLLKSQPLKSPMPEEKRLRPGQKRRRRCFHLQ